MSGGSFFTELREDLLLHAFQVDQHLPATDRVKLRKRRLIDQLMPGKDAHLAQTPVDLAAAFDLNEVTIQPFMDNVCRNASAITFRCGPFQLLTR
jgi:hypothetical protein